MASLEAMFGGAAGGGKSDALLMAALQYVDTPGYSALLLRRTFVQLTMPGSLIPRSKDWLMGTAATWSEQHKRWSFPSGAVLQFGHLEHEDDKYSYQSAEFQFVGFDEATQFTESQYRYLFSRLRRLAGVEVPIRMRAASNPGGIGHGWVKLRYITSSDPQRTFVPSRLEDNPSLDRDEYARSLAYLDPITRAQLLSGDWDAADVGRLFRREWFRVVEQATAGLRYVRYWDLAATEPKAGRDPDYTVGCKVGLSDDGRYYVADVRRTRATPAAVEALIRQTAELDGAKCAVWIEQEPGASGVATIDRYVRVVLQGFEARGNRETGSKVERSRPASSASEAGNVMLVRGGWIAEWLDEIEAFPGGDHDDQVDAFSGAMGRLAKRRPRTDVALLGAESPSAWAYRDGLDLPAPKLRW